jgi:hypothetical protein
MNTLVSLGALASFSMSSVAALVPQLGWPTFFEEPVMLMAFVLLGRAVEERAKLQASSDMTALLNLLPASALLLPPSLPVDSAKSAALASEVPTDVLKAGDFIQVSERPFPIQPLVFPSWRRSALRGFAVTLAISSALKAYASVLASCKDAPHTLTHSIVRCANKLDAVARGVRR